MIEITEKQYALIAPHMPLQCGNVQISNLTIINAILFVAENGCKWRALPPHFGNWHTVYKGGGMSDFEIRSADNRYWLLRDGRVVGGSWTTAEAKKLRALQGNRPAPTIRSCLLYTSDAADD